VALPLATMITIDTITSDTTIDNPLPAYPIEDIMKIAIRAKNRPTNFCLV